MMLIFYAHIIVLCKLISAKEVTLRHPKVINGFTQAIKTFT